MIFIDGVIETVVATGRLARDHKRACLLAAATSVRPSGLKAMAVTGVGALLTGSVSRLVTWPAVLAFQSRTRPSALAVASMRPSGLRAAAVMDPWLIAVMAVLLPDSR